jgi:hypothetical protein
VSAHRCDICCDSFLPHRTAQQYWFRTSPLIIEHCSLRHRLSTTTHSIEHTQVCSELVSSCTITCNGSTTLMFSVVAAPAPHCATRSQGQGRNQSPVVSENAQRAIGAIRVPARSNTTPYGLRATHTSCNLLVITCNPLLACVVKLRSFASATATSH